MSLRGMTLCPSPLPYLPLEKHSKQDLSRYKGKNKVKIGKKEKDGCSQLFVLLTGLSASTESRNHALRGTAITWDGAGVSDPVP